MWTPDGERLVFFVSGERGDAVYWRRADGTGTPNTCSTPGPLRGGTGADRSYVS